jgi:hypothetical protein
VRDSQEFGAPLALYVVPVAPVKMFSLDMDGATNVAAPSTGADGNVVELPASVPRLNTIVAEGDTVMLVLNDGFHVFVAAKPAE